MVKAFTINVLRAYENINYDQISLGKYMRKLEPFKHTHTKNVFMENSTFSWNKRDSFFFFQS